MSEEKKYYYRTVCPWCQNLDHTDGIVKQTELPASTSATDIFDVGICSKHLAQFFPNLDTEQAHRDQLIEDAKKEAKK